MKADDAIETTTRFFNDLIGAIIPGAVLAVGLAIMHLGPLKNAAAVIPKDGGFTVAILLSVLFAAGHGLLAIHSLTLSLAAWSRKKLGLIKKDSDDPLASKQSYICFRDVVSAKLKKGASGEANSQTSYAWGYHDMRSIALSVSTEASSLGRRFMFIGLLCNGVGTALVIMLLDFSFCVLFAPESLFPYPAAWSSPIQIGIMLFGAIAFFERGKEFYARAMSTPFSVALTELAIKPAVNEEP
ncbi:MAG: hypothetical protein ACYC2E_02265 [Sulfuricella sp.]